MPLKGKAMRVLPSGERMCSVVRELLHVVVVVVEVIGTEGKNLGLAQFCTNMEPVYDSMLVSFH